MVVDAAGNIVVAGYTNLGGMNNDFLVTKFKADGSGVSWKATFDKAGGDDQAVSIAIDNGNNVVVTGTVWNGSNTDIHTIKYAPDGTLLWQHTWSGPAGADTATSLAVDGTGDIYVAGYTANASGNDDYLLLKYPSGGTTPSLQEIWNSGYNSNDRIASIAAGVDGVAVTGASSKGGTDFDILTRKYAFNGSLVWEQRKASAGSGDDRGVGIGMDSSGNVLVTGYLYNGTNSDLYTVKYAAASPGSLLWEKTHAGSSNDEPRTILVDGDNDVYVTGHSYTYSGNEDFYTVRYRGSDGVKLWDALYNSASDYTDIPVGIVARAGSDGGLFVVGYTTTSSNENITTVKYRKENGTLLWQQSYNGSANKNERPVGIGLSPSGEVCIAGWSDTASNLYDYIALKYDFGPLDPPTGLSATAASDTAIGISWQDNANNESGYRIERKLGESGSYAEIAVTAADVTSYSDSGLVPNSYYYYRVRSYNAIDGSSAYSNEAHALTKVVSYDPPAWIYQYNGADNREDEAVGITTGSDDHPVVTGYSDLTEEGVLDAYSFDYMTIKLDRGDKSVKWKARYDSGDSGTDMAAGVILDNNGDAIVTGTAYLSGGSDKSDDLYTIKYASSGHSDPNTNPPFVWGGQYGTQAGIDQATAIQAVRDASNSIVVIGHGINALSNEDMFILKYRSDGTSPWPPIVLDGENDGNDYPSAVAVDAAGDIFITGSMENVAGNFDIYTAKYSGTSGTLIWSQLYAGAGSGDDHGLSLAVDPDGDAYMTGSAVNAAGNEEWVTIKYAGAAGAPQREIWQSVHNGPAAPVNGNDRGISVAVDPVDGDIVASGTSYVTATDSDFHLIRYRAADGSVVWERNFDRHDSYEYVTAMAVDSSGYIYVTGNSRSGPDTDPAFDGSSDVLSLIYDFEGTFLGATVHNGGLQDEARAIAVNYRGESFIAGVSLNASNPDYLVLKQSNNYILVPAPLALIPQADASKMNVTWRGNTPGTKFRLERTPAPVLPTSVWSEVTTALPGTIAFLDSGLSAGGEYCYRIYAFTESPSLNSRTIEACGTTTLPATTLSPLVVDSTTQITLSWSQIGGNTGYLVERKVAAGAWGALTTTATDITTYSDSGLTPGTVYTYRVSTLSPAGASLPSSEQTAPTKPLAPALNAPNNITNAQMQLTWGSVTGAASYTLQYKISGGSYANVPACTAIGGTSCTVTGLVAQSSYSFQVKASNSGGDSAWSSETTATAALAVPAWATSPATPTAVTSSGMTITWVNPVVPGAGTITYTLQYRLSGGSYADETTPSACSGTTALSCSVSGLAADTGYVYRIKAANAAGGSLWSSELATKTLLQTPVLAGATGVSATQIDLSWSAVPGATGYTVQQAACINSPVPSTCRGTENGDNGYGSWSNKATGVTTTTYSAGGLGAGQNYRYRIIATNSGNTSLAGNVLHAWTHLTPPTLTITPASSTSLALAWDQQPGETNYTVEASTSGIGGSYAPIPAATGIAANIVTFTHTGLSLGTEYCYKVKAYSTEAAPPPPVYGLPKCMTTPPDAPLLDASGSEMESTYSVIEDGSKYWQQADYFIGRPVVIFAGGTYHTRQVAGNVNSAFYASPAFSGETIGQGESYTILQTVTGKVTGNDPGSPSNSLYDANKNWGMNEWAGYKIKILHSAYSGNIGLERTIVVNGQINPYTSANFMAPLVAGDTYQIARYFGAATAGSTTQLTHSGNSWGSNTWSGHYLMMTSGANNGMARPITAKTSTTLTTAPFPNAIASGDNYLIAPPARVATYFGTAAGAGSSATTLVDNVHVWQANYTGSYLQMTSGLNQGKARLISANDSAAKTITVSPAFESAIAAGDTYTIIPTVQFASYAGTAAGSPGTATGELTDTANSWLVDWTQGYFLMMTSGSNSGQMRTITAKTATTLTVATPFAYPIQPTDSYLIGSYNATSGSGTLGKEITPASTAKGSARVTLANGSADFSSTAPGYGNNYNYGLLSLRDLTPLNGSFDSRFNYSVVTGLTPDSSLPYLYLQSMYAGLRFDFQSPAGKTYNSYLYRGRMIPLDNGRTTAYGSNAAVIYDTRTMAGGATPWKSWGVDQWKDYYLQMTSGPNNQLVRKITANTASSITLESPFPTDPLAGSGTAAAGSSEVRLVDTAASWSVNQWQNYYLHMTGGANAGQTLRIVSSDATSLTVGGTGFASAISAGDSYRIYATSGDSYRINVIAGTAATNGKTQSGQNNTNTLLVDSAGNTGSTLPPKGWSTNQWAGFHLYMTSGPNIGQFRTISSNTADTITVSTPFPYQIASGDSYTIFDPRPAAQAVDAYWVSIYEPLTNVTEQLIFPTSDTAGKLRLARSGSSLQFQAAPATGEWQLLRQLDLASGDAILPVSYWVYHLGRLPYQGGTQVKTVLDSFQFTQPAGTPAVFTPTYWASEVGHTFKRAVTTSPPVEAAWNRVATAISYELERCQGLDPYTPTGRTILGSSCKTMTLSQPAEGITRLLHPDANNGILAGYTYLFRVRAKYNATDYTAWSNEQWVTVTPPAPVIAAQNTGNTTTARIVPSWNNVPGKTGYRLYWKVKTGGSCSDDNWSSPIILGVTSFSYSHNGLTPGTYYCYKVNAIGPAGPPATPDSAYSAISAQTTRPDAPGTITFSGVTASSITLSWPQVSGNSGYQIDRSLDGQTWSSNIATVGQDVTSYTNNGLAAGTLYYYRVSANSAGGSSATSAVQSTTTTPPAVSISLTSVSASRIDLAWQAVSGATLYKVDQRLAAGGSYAPLESLPHDFARSYCGYAYPTVDCPTATPVTVVYQNTGLDGNTAYCYRVTAWNSSGGDSPYSAEQCTSTLAIADQTLTATALNSFKIRLDWTAGDCGSTACTQPEGYEVERMVRDGNWVKIATVGPTTTTFTDRIAIDPIRQYRYRVRSFSGAERSPYAEAVTYTPPYSPGDNVGP